MENNRVRRGNVRSYRFEYGQFKSIQYRVTAVLANNKIAVQHYMRCDAESTIVCDNDYKSYTEAINNHERDFHSEKDN